MLHWSLGSDVDRNVLAANGVQPKEIRELIMEVQDLFQQRRLRYNLERPRLTFGIKPDAGVSDSVAPTAQVTPASDGCPSELAVAAEPPCAGNALAFSSAPSTPGLESLFLWSSVPPYAVASDGSKRHEYSGHGAVPFPDGHDSGWTARIVKKIHVVIIWDPGGYIYGFHATRHAFVHILLHSSAWSRASTLL